MTATEAVAATAANGRKKKSQRNPIAEILLHLNGATAVADRMLSSHRNRFRNRQHKRNERNIAAQTAAARFDSQRKGTKRKIQVEEMLLFRFHSCLCCGQSHRPAVTFSFCVLFLHLSFGHRSTAGKAQ